MCYNIHKNKCRTATESIRDYKKNGKALHLIADNRGQQKEHAAAQEKKSSQDNYSAITTSNN